MDKDSVLFWFFLLPIGLMMWIGLVSFVVWALTEPLADTVEKIAAAWHKGKRQADKR